jgi:hypothetical protein
MRGYVSPPPTRRGKPETARWVSEALEHVAAMPGKTKKR